MRQRNYSMIFAATLLLLFIFTPSVQADDGQSYEVGTSNLNVREAPDFGAEIVGKLQPGDHVIAFKEQNGWISTYYDGKEVWVASQFLFENNDDDVNRDQANEDSSSDNVNHTVTITADSIHLRDGPGINNRVVGLASKGETYDFIKTSNNWHKVRLDNGNTAWIASWLTNKAAGNKSTSHSSDNSSSDGSTDKTSTHTTNTSNQALAGYNIMLDPGHGGIDPGALGVNAEKEKDLALNFTNVVAQKLRDEGATVLLTRSSDSYVSLSDRVRISESYWTHAFISLHFNAYTSSASNGVSTHYYAGGADRELAQYIQTSLEKHTDLRSQGTRQSNYHVLRENSNLAILVELGFITNPYDLGVIQNSNYSSEVADAISEGLINYFNE